MSFYRIMNSMFSDNEDVRYDLQTSKISAIDYKGIATAGSPTSSSVWSIVREDYNSSGQLTMRRYRSNISWDNRNDGWT